MSNPNTDQPTSNPAELALQIYNLLIPLEIGMRRRVLQSAATLLGDSEEITSMSKSHPNEESEDSESKFGPKAMRWAQKHGITSEMLDEIFYWSGGGVEIIASEVPGNSKREKTINCYLLSGIRGLLRYDSPSLEESEVVVVCKRLTAYDKNNHPAHRQAVGNRMSGAKPEFNLTGPGEIAAAELIRQMTARSND